MEHADVAAELFLTADEAMMRSKVEELVQLNADRRKKQDEAYDRCMSMVSGDESFIILRTDEIT